MAKEYKVISDKFVEHLVVQLETDSLKGWEIAAYFQEMGATKLLLVKEKETN